MPIPQAAKTKEERLHDVLKAKKVQVEQIVKAKEEHEVMRDAFHSRAFSDQPNRRKGLLGSMSSQGPVSRARTHPLTWQRKPQPSSSRTRITQIPANFVKALSRSLDTPNTSLFYYRRNAIRRS